MENWPCCSHTAIQTGKKHVKKAIKHAKVCHFWVTPGSCVWFKENVFSSKHTAKQARQVWFSEMKHQLIKTDKIRIGFVYEPLEVLDHKTTLSPVFHRCTFSCFHAVSGDQLLKLIHASKPTTAAIDPVSAKFVLEFTDVLLPVFLNNQLREFFKITLGVCQGCLFSPILFNLFQRRPCRKHSMTSTH